MRISKNLFYSVIGILLRISKKVTVNKRLDLFNSLFVGDWSGLVLQGYYTGRDKINAHITGSYNIGGDWGTNISLCGFKDEYNGKKVLVTVDKKEITLDNWTEKELPVVTRNNIYDLELKNVGTQKCVTITPIVTWDKFEEIPRGKYQIQVQIDNMINTMFIYVEY